MKKLIDILFFVSLTLIMSACKVDDPEDKIIFERNLSDYDWVDDCTIFIGYQFEEGKEIFRISNGKYFLNCYDNKANLLWEKEDYNINVIDIYQDGLLVADPFSKINLDGENDWLIEGVVEDKLFEYDEGSIYSIENSNINKKCIIRLDKDGNILWEKDTYSSTKDVEIENNKIIFEYNKKNSGRVVTVLDFAGNELLELSAKNDYRYFVGDDSFYYYNVWTKILYKYDFSKNIIYTLNDIYIDNFLFEDEDAIFILSQTKIAKIDKDGNELFEITDPSNYLCNYQFHTSFEDGNFIVSSKNINGDLVFYKYNKNGKLIFQKILENELTYVEKFSNGNMIFEYNDRFSNTKQFLIFDLSLNLLYQSEEYSSLKFRNSMMGNFVYDFIKDKKGLIVFNEDSSFYLTKSDSNKDQLFYVDKEGNEKLKFDIYTYNNFGYINNIFLVENKFIFYIYEVGSKTKVSLTDHEGNIEALGDYLGIVYNNNERTYYIKNNDQIEEFTVTYSNLK